ncbi:MAG TPA: DUF1735 domain-containing protein [Ginsengibacter sp.]
MKIIFNKWMGILTGAMLLINLNSCIKDKGYALETDFSGLQDHVILIKGGLTNFSNNNIQFSSDTVSYNITADLASVNLPKSSLNVTIGVDASLIASYNAANGTDFLLMPTDAYTLAATSLTIPAGQQYATTTLQVYQDKVDPTQSYMLPISITDASGKTLTSNLNTVYFNIIGNIIAGAYNWDFTRWSAPSNAGSPDGNSFTGKVNSFIADNASQVEVSSGYYIGPRYVISFIDSSGVPTQFKVKLNADDVATMTTGGVTVTDGPNIIKADPVTGEYIFQYTTVTRYVIDRYYK